MECKDGTLAHHWEIEPSRGTTSKGTCRKCNLVQEFTNSMGNTSINWKTVGKKTYSVIRKDNKKE